MEIYFVSVRIQSERGKIWTRENPNTTTFYEVISIDINLLYSKHIIEIKHFKIDTTRTVKYLKLSKVNFRSDRKRFHKVGYHFLENSYFRSRVEYLSRNS